ncbi:hypothetical protein RB195_003882 [Necator americanus]|uniref:Protein kinase domain-containing protein n=1 Tax=Necator americanus TaxID=51031 RepID=A0ABR1DQL6_NECAM
MGAQIQFRINFLTDTVDRIRLDTDVFIWSHHTTSSAFIIRMTTRRRYGTYGRAVTLPAPVLSPTGDWPRPTELPWRAHVQPPSTAVQPPVILPIESPSRRIEARLRQRMINERLRAVHVPIAGDDGKASIQELMDRYLNKSRESITRQSTPPSPTTKKEIESEEIRKLLNRYTSPGAGSHHEPELLPDSTTLEAEPDEEATKENLEQLPPLPMTDNETDGRIRWRTDIKQKNSESSKKPMNVYSTNTTRMPVGGGSSSRSGRLARISQSNIRPFGSGGVGGGYGPGGHPLSGPDPSSPTKKEVKHRFEITKKLGSGTYGKVSLAFDHKFEREVAVKLIKKSAIENKADLIRIRREIRIMSALHHPNIIQIYEVFENREKIILVMEYACGGELYDYVSHFGSLPESEARRIFRQITSAVLYCHKHQVAHRDLKLENILLDQDNNAKIADFGLSNYFGNKTLLTTFCGSPLYASPEIINGTPYRGPEVDCWSLGILLYTLVYGSMPFDGRDFNRMVRQIKRGAYYEPDTPSTASMLIRNMLRVNPERRADIFDIASHWWLNLEENMPVIQELPENQITDHTPLTERAETMIVQDLADETDVFMEFGHLSNETRKKIEEFRRRRKQAEEYNENSPVKPPKVRKDGEPEVEMRSEEKSLRGVKEDAKKQKEKEINDPLERLRQIENRLGQQRTKQQLGNVPKTAAPDKEVPGSYKPLVNEDHTPAKPTTKPEPQRESSPEQPEDPKSARNEPPPRADKSSRAPSFVPVSEPEPTTPPPKRYSNILRTPMSAAAYRLEVDSLNMLMNQVLEQMEKGPVSLNLVARVKAHPMYDSRPMVKELLESIMAAQPEKIQRETSKLVQQQSQDVARKQQKGGLDATKGTATVTATKRAEKLARAVLAERPWVSVEVGFDPEEESEVELGHQQSIASNATEVTVQSTSFEDSDDQHENVKKISTSNDMQMDRQTQTVKEEEEAETDEDEEYTDSEMEELADEVEQVEQKIVVETSDTLPPPDPVVAQPQFLDAFDRGLAKRQSKGKYQHSRVDMYGRGVSTECESPTLPRKPLGGPQPTQEQSPFLFDKAKKIIMQYPGRPDLSEIEDGLIKKKKDWLKTQDPDQQGGSDASVTPTPSCVGSVPPRTPPPMDHEHETRSEEAASDESDEEEESEEESDTEIQSRHHRGPIIGEVRRDGDKIEVKATDLVARKLSYMQSAPASIHTSPSPEPRTPTSATRYYTAIAELKLQAPPEPKPYKRMSGSSLVTTQATIEPKATVEEPEKPKPKELKPAEESRTGGKESWETAAAFIRRKNRDRRNRNRTIGAPEELLRDLDKATESVYDELPMSAGLHAPYTPTGVDSFYAHHAALPGSSVLNYVRPRYNDESYRRHDERPLSPNRPNTNAALLREEFRSAYDPSQDYNRTSSYGTGDVRNYYSSNASSSYSKKLDENQSWASEPRRFEVYKTRAERDAERNTYTPSGAPSYRPSSYYSSASDRPLTNFAVRKPEDSYKPDAYRGAESAYRRYDDSYGYKRIPYEFEKGATPASDTYAPSAASHVTDPNPIVMNRFRPTARRTEDRPSYIRTRSMDRKHPMGDEFDYTEPIPDYTYVNYHDTSNGRATSVSKDDKGQPRSILKNKQSVDMEQRGIPDESNSTIARNEQGNVGPVRSVIDRLRRHLSLEKSASPQRQTGPQQTMMGSSGSSRLTTNSRDSHDRAVEDNPKKKRSLLSFNRRRTSELRMGSDGKLVTNGYDDVANYKRPSSPIDKIKSLFRRNDTSHVTSQLAGSDYYPGRYTSTSTNDKVYGAYPSTNVAAAREAYVPQYRKYPGSTTRDPASVLNRYSYTPGLTDQRRHWNSLCSQGFTGRRLQVIHCLYLTLSFVSITARLFSIMIPTKGSDQVVEMSNEDASRLPSAEPHRNESHSSEEVVKKICFASGCDVNSHPISGDVAIPDQEYLDQLIKDKGDLRSIHAVPFRHLGRLIDREIARVVAAMSAQVHIDDATTEEERGEKVCLTEMILVPVDRYPRYNFVGRILGPRGMTAKQLEEDTGCKIMVRGRGSSRMSGSRRERNNDTEPLHVLIQCEDYEKRAQQKMRNAVEAINQLLHPPPEGKDELKRKQLIELSIINGTYRPTSATKSAMRNSETSRPSSPAHFPSAIDNSSYSEQARLLSQFAEAAKQGKKNELEEQYAALAQMLTAINPVQQPNNVNCNYYDYYKNLLSFTLSDPGFLTTLLQSLDLYGMGIRSGIHHAPQHHHHMVGQAVSPNPIPHANLHQYLTAAAMLNSVPFPNDGSGDCPKNKIRNSA